ncbi:MAG: substrate-binding domain-containing protein [Cyanobacteria bacterium P01_A01_bin.37]
MVLFQFSQYRVLRQIPLLIAMVSLLCVACPNIAKADLPADLSIEAMVGAIAPLTEVTDGITAEIADELVRDTALTALDETNPKTVKIDGSNMMESINQSLKQRFEQEFPSTAVTLDVNGTESALKALLDDDIDLAAIGRPLTADEKAQGLVEIPISQDQIVIIIGRQNPFNGHLTLEQFAQIFRGDITDWAEVGGTPGPIQLIDRPVDSDTRRVLEQYGLVAAGEQAVGKQVVRLKTDDTAEVIRKLGVGGISYAIASQIEEQRRVKPVKMAVLLDTLPADTLYPYSQVRGYAYKKESEAAVLPFVNFATGDAGQSAVLTAKSAEAKAVAQALRPASLATIVQKRGRPRTGAIATSTGTTGNDSPIWLLLFLPLSLLLLLLFVAKRQQSPSGTEDVGSSTESAAVLAKESRPDPAVTSRGETVIGAEATSPPVTNATPVQPLSPTTDEVAPAPEPASLTDSLTGEAVPSTEITDSETEVPTAQERYDQGWGWLDAKRYDDALQAFEQALANDSNFYLAWIGKGRALFGLQRYTEAIASFDTGFDWLTNLNASMVPGGLEFVAMAWLYRGWAKLKLGQADSALGDLNHAIAFDGTLVDAWMVKGDTLLALGQVDEGNACYAQASALRTDTSIPADDVTISGGTVVPLVERTPTIPVTPSAESQGDVTIPAHVDWDMADQVYQHGLGLLDSGQIQEAIACFRRVVELNSAFYLAWLKLGSAQLKAGQFQEALESYDRVIVLKSDELDAWVGKGDCLTLLGRSDDAQPCYAESATLKGDRPTPDTPSDQGFVSPPAPPSLGSIGVSGNGSPAATPAAMQRRPPGEGTVAADSALLDLVVLVNTQASLHDEVQSLSQAVEGAIATAASGRSADARVTWLGTHGSLEGTPIQEGVVDYLSRISKPSLTDASTDSASASQLITSLIQQFDWRPGSAQSLFYIGNDVIGDGAPAESLSMMEAVKKTGTIINTYLVKAKNPSGAAAEAEYTQLAQMTGGLAFTDQAAVRDFRDVLEQVIDSGCRFCVHRRLTIHSQRDCYELDQRHIDHLQSTANSTPLSPGSYIIRIKDGAFSYSENNSHVDPEPWVMLWIYGGRFVNQKTKVEVGATWVALNGYNDTLKLEVLEATTLCALFLDTYKDDNSGQITLSVLKSDD